MDDGNSLVSVILGIALMAFLYYWAWRLGVFEVIF